MAVEAKEIESRAFDAECPAQLKLLMLPKSIVNFWQWKSGAPRRRASAPSNSRRPTGPPYPTHRGNSSTYICVYVYMYIYIYQNIYT